MINWYNKCKNMIKTGINISIDDALNIQKGVYKWLGRSGQTVQSIVPFGTFGTPSIGNPAILFCLRGHESNVAALNIDPQNRIKKETKPGEYGIGNPLTKSNLYFNEAGDCLMVSEGGMINFNNGDKGVARLDDTVSTTLNQTDLAAIGVALAGLYLPAPTPVPPSVTVPVTGSNFINSSSSSVKAGD